MTEKQQDNPPTREQRMQAMLDLSNKFGGSDKIPEEELTAIGYARRISDDGTIRLLPQERLESLAKKDKDWEKPLREKERPFNRIPIVLSTTEQAFRHIPTNQQKILIERLREIEQAFDNPWRSFEEGNHFRAWWEKEVLDGRLQNMKSFYLGFKDFVVRDTKAVGVEFDDIELNSWFFAQPPRRDPSGQRQETTINTSDSSTRDYWRSDK